MSATHGKEAVGQLTACSPTQEGTAQLDLLLKSPRPDLEREEENQAVRRPLKLAPLELPEEVREAQKQKLKFIQQEGRPASCKLDVTVNEPHTRRVKSCTRQRLEKAAACPPASTEPLKAQQENRSSRPQLTRSNPVQQNGDKHLEDVVCHGTPAPLRNRPAPPLLSPLEKARATRGAEASRQNLSTLQPETGRRRPRLRRAQCLEEDQCNSNTSTGGLSADKGKLAQGVQGKGQRGLREASCMQQKASKTLLEPSGSTEASGRAIKRIAVSNLQWADGGSSEHALDGVKPSASNWRLRGKKTLNHKA
ncbi:hypothetical protein GBF38_010912 [Nibea albiflora]|uniref:Uncharacterized protein n=1 Tax=Nibea albiflora TaxID=240163 RepID=A0ACB7ES57_NIBAL|nr:hypothetical protein GBF38_010912 [Nibea albiflora]